MILCYVFRTFLKEFQKYVVSKVADNVILISNVSPLNTK